MNRAGVSLVRDRGPAAPAQDEIAWPPFLMRKDLNYTPTATKWLPRENFCWCSRPLAPSPIYSSSSLLLKPNLLSLLHRGNTLSAKVPLPWWWSNATTSSVQGSLDLFSRPPARSQMKGFSSLGRQQYEGREGISVIVLQPLIAPESMNIFFHKHTESLVFLQQLFLFPDSLVF